MVSYKQILASNSLINDSNAPRISVFIGGTSGIGRLTLLALVATGASLKIYLLGRKSSEPRITALIDECHDLNPKAQVIWLAGEASLLADTQRFCETVKQRENRVDLVFLTAGYAPFGPRQETSEGIEVTQALEYYGRVLCVLQLLPLLNAAEAPRVVSVLAGGVEKVNMNVDDIDLKRPENWGIVAARMQSVTLNTVSWDLLASENPHVTFLHTSPGLVNTGNVWRGVADQNSLVGWLVWLFLDPLIGLLAFRDEESAQRHLFMCTSAAFGGRGVSWTGPAGVNSLAEQAGGLFLVGSKCDCTPNAKVVSLLRDRAQAKVWAHTQGVLQHYV